MELDPVTLALVQSRLDFISRHMGWVMTRTARSPIFSQSHDFSCFLTDRAGTLVSNADGIPIHTGGGGFAVRALLDPVGDGLTHVGDPVAIDDDSDAVVVEPEQFHRTPFLSAFAGFARPWCGLVRAGAL